MLNIDSGAAPSHGPIRVLIAISSPEQKNFLPMLADTPLPGADVRLFDTEHGTAESWLDLLQTWRPEVLVAAWSTPHLPPGYLDAADCPLRYICYVTGTVRSLVTRDFIQRGGLVTNWGSEAAPTVAEHALLLTLAALRRQAEWRPFMENPPTFQVSNTFSIETRSLYGRRVGLYGFGRIARELARLIQPFQTKCSAFSVGVPPGFIREHGVEPCGSLAELFTGSDVLVVCEALNAATVNSVTAELLEMLPPDAVFVNVGRGQVVDEEALAALAAAGRIRVACDVFAHEPLPPDASLRKVPSAVLSPHLAGPTRDHMPRCGAFALHNLARYVKGEPVEQPLSVDVFDRST